MPRKNDELRPLDKKLLISAGLGKIVSIVLENDISNTILKTQYSYYLLLEPTNF